jgi:hypothetical protein
MTPLARHRSQSVHLTGIPEKAVQSSIACESKPRAIERRSDLLCDQRANMKPVRGS